jgi:hypothetical protein
MAHVPMAEMLRGSVPKVNSEGALRRMERLRSRVSNRPLSRGLPRVGPPLGWYCPTQSPTWVLPYMSLGIRHRDTQGT